MHCFVRQRAVCRAGNAHAGEVKVIGAVGSEVELLWGNKLRRQLGYVRRNIIVRSVELAIAAKPLEVAAGISVGAGQTFGRRRGKALAGFHNDLDSIRASSQFSAAKVKGNGFQPVRASVPGFRTSRTGRKPTYGLEYAASLSSQKRAEKYPRTARYDVPPEETSCPHENI